MSLDREHPAVREYFERRGRASLTPQFLGASRTRHLSKRRRREIARAAALARWERVRQTQPVTPSE